MDADQHARHGQRRRAEQDRDRPQPEEHQQHPGDRERRQGMVAREARVGGMGEERVDLPGMGDERARPVDERRDQPPPPSSARPAASPDTTPATVSAVAPEGQADEHEADDQGEEQRLGDRRPRARGILPAVVARGEVVGVLGPGEIRVNERHAHQRAPENLNGS